VKKFIYKDENGHVHMEMQGMYLTQAAAEIGHIAQEIYTALHRQDPGAADLFKTATIMALVHPDSPTWTVKEYGEDAVGVCIMSNKPK
jgi:hypothetical protein